jgi:molybdate transport system substrate-binding protein
MKSPQLSSAILGVGLAVFCAQADPACAAEIKVWTARAIATVLAEVGPEFERQTGHRLSVTTDLSPAFVSRAHAGESFDVMITGSDPLAALAKDGKIIADTRTHIARSGIGVAVRDGAPRPDIATPEALKRALLAARTVSYSRVGASGIYTANVLIPRLGIAEEMKSRAVVSEPGTPVGVLIADGKAEIGLQQISELVPVPGIDIVGPLPGDLQKLIPYSAGVLAKAKDAETARALVRFLASETALTVIKRKGMDPAS